MGDVWVFFFYGKNVQFVESSHLSGQRDPSNPHTGVSRGASVFPPAQWISLPVTYSSERFAAM